MPAWMLDAIAGLLLLELLWLLTRRPRPVPALLHAVSGLGLVLAWRSTLAGLPLLVTLACLALGGLGHGLLRWWMARPGD